MVRALLVALLFLPLSVFASVTVTDVMYDVAGSDTGREWVELRTDSPIQDIRMWRFLEGGVKHKITGTDGAVPAGTAFVLAADATTFRTEHPEFTGPVFDTVMSLSNSGETLALIDASGVVVVTHAYVAAPKPVVEKPVAQKIAKSAVTKSEPRVLGVATSTPVPRAKQVAAAIEGVSPEWAWFSLIALAGMIAFGIGALAYIQFKP
jgi:hypothetical protein